MRCLIEDLGLIYHEPKEPVPKNLGAGSRSSRLDFFFFPSAYRPTPAPMLQ